MSQVTPQEDHAEACCARSRSMLFVLEEKECRAGSRAQQFRGLDKNVLNRQQDLRIAAIKLFNDLAKTICVRLSLLHKMRGLRTLAQSFKLSKLFLRIQHAERTLHKHASRPSLPYLPPSSTQNSAGLGNKIEAGVLPHQDEIAILKIGPPMLFSLTPV